MHILYVHGGCSPAKYSQYVESRGRRIQQQSQKYNQLLMEGLRKNGAQVTAICSRPINRTLTSKIFFPAETDYEKEIQYFHVPFFNLPVLRNLSVFFSTFCKILSWKNPQDTVIFCDSLNISAAIAAQFAAKLRHICITGIITDVPCHRPNRQKIPLHEHINLRMMQHFDRYLLLTEQMNRLVNPKHRPSVVLEGHVDIAMQGKENLLAEKYPTKVCLYAGTLRRIYGIEHLVQGFLQANIPDTELHIYGDGEYAEQLQSICSKHPNIKYKGVASNETIIREEIKATLLVNPRPTDEDYTQYSFPSKNMEYMASGTPVLTTCLPGMPKEYNDYVFLLTDETAEGMAAALREVFSRSTEQLHEAGRKAKQFVLEQKNNCIQAGKVLEMIHKEV